MVSVSACRCSWTRLGFRIVKKTALVESIETDQSGSLEAAFTEKPCGTVGHCLWMHSSKAMTGTFGDSLNDPVCGDCVTATQMMR